MDWRVEEYVSQTTSISSESTPKIEIGIPFYLGITVAVIGIGLAIVGLRRPRAQAVAQPAVPQEATTEQVQAGAPTKFCRRCGAKTPRDTTSCQACGADLT